MTSTTPLEPLNRFPRMVQEYFVGRVRKAEQLAEKLGVPLGTVKSRIRLAFGKMKTRLGDD